MSSCVCYANSMEKPRLLQGFRDFLPDQMRARNHVIDTVKKVYESYGFEPLDTPALEYAELLMGKYGEDEKLIYNFQDHGDRHVALRYDLTVPLARVVASYQHLPKPFKRYQVGSVWRADSPQAGRYREFMQMDADTVGASSPLADAEMLTMMDAMYQALGLEHFTIHVNHRGVLSAFLKALRISESHIPTVLRIIDKLAKIGKHTAEAQLKVVMEVDAIKQLFDVFDQEDAEVLLNDLHSFITEEQGLIALENFEQILALTEKTKTVKVNLAVVRGLDYYTGLIYEVTLKDSAVGSICGGGRYDDLMAQLSGQAMPAIGTSLGVDRLLSVVGESPVDKQTLILVGVFPGFEKQAFALAAEIRQAGICTVLGLGSEKLGKQMQYADAIGASKVLLCGDNEAAKGVVLVRDMKSGEQEEVQRSELVASLGSKF